MLKSLFQEKKKKVFNDNMNASGFLLFDHLKCDVYSENYILIHSDGLVFKSQISECDQKTPFNNIVS